MDIDDPLKPVPFSCFPRIIGWDSSIDMFIYDQTTIHGYLRNKHIYPRAADRRWNKFIKEEPTEPEHDIPGEEVPSLAE